MKTLHAILRRNSNRTTMGLLSSAAQARGIRLNPVIIEDFDFSNPPRLGREDAVYIVSMNAQCRLTEKVLMNDEVVSFYRSPLYCYRTADNVVTSTLIHEKLGLPIVKTVFSVTKERHLLQQYVQYLDGFPLIIKSRGGMHGIGVMKVDSFDSLVSVAGFLARQNQQFILRKFIPHTRQARMIVVGNEVVASHENLTSVDFRTNSGKNADRKRRVADYPDEVKQIAVQAVHALGYEFGGVDIIFDEVTGTPYITEVNFPCYFPTTQLLTGVDIAGRMLDHLAAKASAMTAVLPRKTSVQAYIT